MPDWLWKLLLAAVIVQIPFEVRYKLLGLSNLQWTFAALALASSPLLIRNGKALIRDRLVQAAAVFVTIQWIAALIAPEFHTNAIKAAVRFSAGLFLLAIVRASASEKLISKLWLIASAAAALYGLIEYAGFGLPWLFRMEEFYVGQVPRLSGSFEYPNTAAAYFTMSLPIVWWSSFRPYIRAAAVFLLWCATVLTFSKGALLAVPVVLAFSLRRQWKKTAALMAIGVAAYVVLLPLNPLLLERLFSPTERPIAAQYQTDWNYLQEQPGKIDTLALTMRNTGVSAWRSAGWRHVSVGYRWWDMGTEQFIDARPMVTALPCTVGRGETVQVQAAFLTPAQPGRYLLVVEPFSRSFDWFSNTGVIPRLIQADIRSDAEKRTGQSDLSALYNRGRRPGFLSASISRRLLWRAALRIFSAHPLGIGPDNYRLVYGRYLGATRWDTHVYSNNLYLEVLAGSGVLGLAAFLLMLAFRRWGGDPASTAIGVFLVHGIVDVFVMATPIYFAFWMFLGMEDK